MDQGAATTRELGRIGTFARGVSLSFAELFANEYDGLVQTLAHVVGDRDQAAESVQEAFVRFYQRYPSPGDCENPVGWLYRVSLNRVRDQYRSRLRLNTLLPRLASGASQGSSLPDTDLLAALRGLSRRQRTAAVLFYLRGFSIAEVAEAMAISEGAVNQHLHRARQTLRQLIEVG